MHGFPRVSRAAISSWNSIVAAYYPRGDGLLAQQLGETETGHEPAISPVGMSENRERI